MEGDIVESKNISLKDIPQETVGQVPGKGQPQIVSPAKPVVADNVPAAKEAVVTPPVVDKQALAAQQAAEKQATADKQAAAKQAAADKQAAAKQAAQPPTMSKTAQPSTPAKSMKYVKIDKDGKFMILLDPVKHEYFIQTGAFKKQEVAEKLAKTYQNVVPCMAVIVFDEDLYKVRFGPFKSSAEYNECVNKILENK
jgi:cell division protein FtsN